MASLPPALSHIGRHGAQAIEITWRAWRLGERQGAWISDMVGMGSEKVMRHKDRDATREVVAGEEMRRAKRRGGRSGTRRLVGRRREPCTMRCHAWVMAWAL
eukprot:8481394-Pyramimonas_sp.AAC.1